MNKRRQILQGCIQEMAKVSYGWVNMYVRQSSGRWGNIWRNRPRTNPSQTQQIFGSLYARQWEAVKKLLVEDDKVRILFQHNHFVRYVEEELTVSQYWRQGDLLLDCHNNSRRRRWEMGIRCEYGEPRCCGSTQAEEGARMEGARTRRSRNCCQEPSSETGGWRLCSEKGNSMGEVSTGDRRETHLVLSILTSKASSRYPGDSGSNVYSFCLSCHWRINVSLWHPAF